MTNQVSGNRPGIRLVIFPVIFAASLIFPESTSIARPIPLPSKPASGIILAGESEVRPLIARFSTDERSIDRYYFFEFSSARRRRFDEFDREWLGILAEMNFEALNRDGKIDAILFKNHLTRRLRQRRLDAAADERLAPFLPFAEKIISLHEDLKKARWIRGADAARALHEIKSDAISTQKAFSGRQAGSGVDRFALKQAAGRIERLESGLKNWFDFYNGYDPDFTWWAARPIKAAFQALESYADFLCGRLNERRPGESKHVYRDPAGREALMDELAFEMIPYTPEEILKLGWQELAWCEEQRRAAARDLGYEDDWRAAIEHVKNLCVDPGRQPELIRGMAWEAVEFLEKHESLTIPPLVKEILRIEMMSPQRQRSTPFFTGGEVISVAYPTNTMPYEQVISTMRGNNPHFSRAVVHHELVPGHNLQMFQAARHKSYRRPFSTRFFIEGWPLYWEMRLWDMGFQRSPEDRIGMLFWRMHRCARIIFSMKFQLGEWTGDECIDFLVERIGHERDNATVEVTRDLGVRSNPLNQISYLTGGLQMRALSQELVDSGKMTAREFHDAALLEGSIPIELLRTKLSRQDLDENFSTRWKFYTFRDSGARQ